ncbi:hypothetical protein NXF59_28295, partial [Klebsiella pneumoniae]|nr:hypothetical protein [Klebsiella pneumoniae]
SAQIREILINESAWEEMTCLFALSLTESEIFARIDADLVSKVFSVNIKQINNIVHSNVCVIPIQTQAKQVNFAAGVMASCFKNF